MQVDLLLTNPCWTLESKWFSVRCRIKLLAIIRSIILLATQVRDRHGPIIHNTTSSSLLKDWCNYGCFPFLGHESYRQQLWEKDSQCLCNTELYLFEQQGWEPIWPWREIWFQLAYSRSNTTLIKLYGFDRARARTEGTERLPNRDFCRAMLRQI